VVVTMVGVVPAFVAAVGFAVFQTVNRRALSGIDVYRGTASVLAIGSVLLVGLSIALHGVAGFLAVDPVAYGYFGAAGFVHFFCGWTLLGISQLRLGAARAGIVVGTLPLFGALVAAMALDEPLSAIDVVGLLLVVGGVALVIPVRGSPPATGARPAGGTAGPSTSTVLLGVTAGLGAALLWSLSPVLIRGGLAYGAGPITGAAIGQATAAATYGLSIAATTGRRRGGSARSAIGAATRRLIVAAGGAVALAIWMQWTAYDLAPIAVVLSVLQLTPPLVVVLATVLARERLGEQAGRVWLGSLVTLGGAMLLVAM
jgi:drug/metabolite transporter (DMT)-like permease